MVEITKRATVEAVGHDQQEIQLDGITGLKVYILGLNLMVMWLNYFLLDSFR